MSDILHWLGAKSSDFGPLADIVKYATCGMAAAFALIVLVRGRSRKWEPADTEVPRLAERTAIVVGAVVTVIVFVLMNDRRFIPALAVAAGIAAILLFVAFFRFLRLSESNLHDAPHLARNGQHVTQKIVGDEDHLTPEAKKKRKAGVSLHDLIWGCGQKFDDVFERKRRSDVKVKFQIAYFQLVLCFIIALACTGQLLSIATATTQPTTATSR